MGLACFAVADLRGRLKRFGALDHCSQGQQSKTKLAQGGGEMTRLQPPKKENVMSFKSILSDIGHGIKNVFDAGQIAAKAAEPFVDLAFPGVAPLFNSIVQQVGMAEAAAAAAGAENGTGAQKMALVLKSIETSIANYEKTNNLATPMTQVQIEAAANAVVAFLNALPAKDPNSVVAAPAVAEPEPALVGAH